MGQLLLGLACAGSAPVPPSVELAALHYSPDLLRLLGLLLGVGEGGVFSWRHLIALMGERALMELDTLNMFNNNLVSGRWCMCVYVHLVQRWMRAANASCVSCQLCDDGTYA
jgi:hypothetical protein